MSIIDTRRGNTLLREHDNGEGCVCHLIGREVILEKLYDSPWVGTCTFHIKGSDKRVRLSEVGLPNIFQ